MLLATLPFHIIVLVWVPAIPLQIQLPMNLPGKAVRGPWVLGSLPALWKARVEFLVQSDPARPFSDSYRKVVFPVFPFLGTGPIREISKLFLKINFKKWWKMHIMKNYVWISNLLAQKWTSFNSVFPPTSWSVLTHDLWSSSGHKLIRHGSVDAFCVWYTLKFPLLLISF